MSVHCKKSPYDVYIGRPSKWGNPFAIGRDGTRDEVILKYRQYLLGNARLLAQVPELKGKVLGCWCAPNACHGDVLEELANNPIQRTTLPQESFLVPEPGTLRPKSHEHANSRLHRRASGSYKLYRS